MSKFNLLISLLGSLNLDESTRTFKFLDRVAEYKSKFYNLVIVKLKSTKHCCSRFPFVVPTYITSDYLVLIIMVLHEKPYTSLEILKVYEGNGHPLVNLNPAWWEYFKATADTQDALAQSGLAETAASDFVTMMRVGVWDFQDQRGGIQLEGERKEFHPVKDLWRSCQADNKRPRSTTEIWIRNK
jgi:hypothetical protein